MIDATIAKFVCRDVDNYGPSQSVKLTAVYEPRDGTNEENKSFSASTPNGEIRLTVDNQAVHGFFEENVEYIVTIERA